MTWTGWVKKYRKVMDSVVWADPYQYKLFDMLVMLANHDGGKVIFGGKEISVSSGELVTGRDAIAFMYNKGAKNVHQKSPRVLWRWIKNFEKAGMLSIKSTTKYSVISITNWGRYQESDQQMSINGPSTVHQVSTNKNVKNVEKTSGKSAKRTFPPESHEYQLADRLWRRIKGNNPEAREPNLQSWANDIRLMHERDQRTWERIANMIDWSQKDSFWSGNILSAKKLREQYDKMRAKAISEYKQDHRGAPPPAHPVAQQKFSAKQWVLDAYQARGSVDEVLQAIQDEGAPVDPAEAQRVIEEYEASLRGEQE